MEGFKNWLLNEMPANIRHLGNWDRPESPDGRYVPPKKKYGWQNDDFGILTNQRGVEKIKQKWAKVPQEIDMYLVRSPLAYKQVEIGEVNEDFLRNQLGLDIVDYIANPEEMGPNQVTINPEAISVFYTNNRGSERVPFTYWTAAHRLGHALRRTRAYQEFTDHFDRELQNLVREVYGIQNRSDAYYMPTRIDENTLKAFANAIGTMKAARDKNLRNYFEFHHELFAQHIINGQVTFNPLPQDFGDRYAWGRRSPKHWARLRGEEFEEMNEHLQQLAHDTDYLCNQALDHAIGSIFVM